MTPPMNESNTGCLERRTGSDWVTSLHASSTDGPVGKPNQPAYNTSTVDFGKPMRNLRPDQVQMKQEHNRRLSFSYWAQNSTVRGNDLAAAGFYFIGPQDKVKCAFCYKRIKNWVCGDDAVLEHQRLSPMCTFVAGMLPSLEKNREKKSMTKRSDDDTAAGSLHNREVRTSTHDDETADVMYTDFDARLQSFALCSLPVSKQELASAGFFYSAERKTIRCFVCHVEIREFSTVFNIWTTHAQKSPQCLHLQRVKGSNFIVGALTSIKPTGIVDMTSQEMAQKAENMVKLKNLVNRRPCTLESDDGHGWDEIDFGIIPVAVC